MAGFLSMTEKFIEKCQCPWCMQDERYWAAFENIIQALAALLTLCVNNRSPDSYNWLLTHVEGMFQAAGQALNEGEESRVVH